MTMTSTGTARPIGSAVLSYAIPPTGRLFQVRIVPEVESPPIVAMYPDTELPYGFEWYNLPVTTTWTVDAVSATGRVRGRVTQIMLSGVVDGQVYRLSNRVTFADGTTDARMIIVRCLAEIE